MRTFGKPSRTFFQKVIFPRLGAKRSQVLVGPKFGVDNAVLDIGNGKVLVTTTDPLSYIPQLGPEASAWLSVNLLASDLTTSGLSPQYGIFDFNLPPEMEPGAFAEYWHAFDGECRKLGISVVAGHTGRYQGCNYTVVGGGVLCAVGDGKRYLLSTMAEVGDDIVLTKGAAVETTAVLTRAFPRTVREALGSELFARAQRYLTKVTTVKDAIVSASVGIHGRGVTAMHDATEGGIIAASLELANASGLGMELWLDEVPVSEETQALCRLFRIDPLTSLSEGSLILTSKPYKTDAVLRALNAAGIRARAVGGMKSRAFGHRGVARNRSFRLKYPDADPYWKAYWQATKKGWK
jgi:hydrogenase expression/formation protein HypE